MLYGFLATLFVILCFLMILIILFQKSKGSLGIIGSAGSGAQMLFGGTGGQDLFQKITWGFVAFFLGGSLLLAVLKSRQVNSSSYLTKATSAPVVAPAASQDVTAPAASLAEKTETSAPAETSEKQEVQ